MGFIEEICLFIVRKVCLTMRGRITGYLKKVIVWCLWVLIIVACSGCSYKAYKDYFTEVNSYSGIWDLPGMRGGKNNGDSIFPQDISSLNVETFFCRYDEQLPIGEGIQILVQIRYDDIESFRRETQRLQSLYADCDAYFDVDGYDFIASSLSGADFLEYAAIHENEQTVLYVYLQDLPYDEIEFDEKFIPNGYTGYGEIN